MVTKKLSDMLLQIVQKPDVAIRRAAAGWNNEDTNLLRDALTVFGVDNFNGDQSYYGVERSLLVYMAAAVLHPVQEKREKFKKLLVTRGIHLDKIADQLVVFMRYFIASLPTSSSRGSSASRTLTGNFFDCLEQGKNIQRIFDKFANGQNADGTFAATGEWMKS